MHAVNEHYSVYVYMCKTTLSGVRMNVLYIEAKMSNSVCMYTRRLYNINGKLGQAGREIDMKSFSQKFLMIVSTIITCAYWCRVCLVTISNTKCYAKPNPHIHSSLFSLETCLAHFVFVALHSPTIFTIV